MLDAGGAGFVYCLSYNTIVLGHESRRMANSATRGENNVLHKLVGSWVASDVLYPIIPTANTPTYCQVDQYVF